jgi:polyphosphate kinase
MPRNFHRRVEVMFPVEAPDLKERILQEVLPIYRRDNERTRVLQSDGTYVRIKPAAEEEPHRAQMEFLAADMEPARRAARADAAANGSAQELGIVRDPAAAS